MTVKGFRWLTLLLCVSLLETPSHGQDNPYWQRVHVRGTVNPSLGEEGRVTIFALDQSQGCFTWDKPRGALCSAFVARGATSARIEIHVRGYKPYTINVPKLAFVNDAATVNIGTISLIKSELPSVRRIISGQSNGKRVFELTLLNKLQRDVLITRMVIGASRPGNGMMCCCPPAAIYEISDQLTVTGGSSGTVNAKGEYSEKVQGKDYSVDIQARIIRSTCDGATSLTITAPVSFVIPKDSFSAIQIALPQRFNISNSYYGPSRDEPRGKPSVFEMTGDLNQFAAFSFTISTGEKDELDIEAFYPGDP